jgi:hypothetical protein
MKPTQVDLIRCIEASLEEHIAANLTGAMAQSQLLTIRYLLDQARLRVEHEPEALMSFEADARETLGQICTLRVDALSDLQREIRDLLATDVPSDPAGRALAALEYRTTRLREYLDRALRDLGEAGSADRGAARLLLHECIGRQLDREAAWLHTGYPQPRR